MIEIVKYKSDNGKEFNNRFDAVLEDTKHLLAKQLEGDMFRGISSEDLADVIVEKIDEYYALIAKINGNVSLCKKHKS